MHPSVLKNVKVLPIFKKGNKLDYTNYRPISIVPVISKTFEIILNRQIVKYFEDNMLFSESQFGFRCGSNTTCALSAFIKNCLDEVEKGNIVISRFFLYVESFRYYFTFYLSG